jgi:hypothetical protein
MEWSTPLIAWLVIQFVCFLAVLLAIKLSTNLSWPMVFCWSVFLAQVIGIILLPFRLPACNHFFTVVGLMKKGVFLPALACAVVLAIRLIVWLSTVAFSTGTVDASDRDRILRMVEDGKISGQEGSDLLDAMGRSTALRGEEKFSRLDVVILVGVALVVLGFFLPWMHVNWTKQMPGSFPRVSGYQAGSHVGAIGWAVLIIACLSALTVFITPKNFLYKISMLQIFLTLVGLVLVISFLVRAGEQFGAGLIICLAGFVVELCASAAKFRKLAA